MLRCAPLFIVSLTVAAGLAAPNVCAAANLKQGRAIAEENCGRCHAVGKTGASRNPKSPPFRTLGERYPVDERDGNARAPRRRGRAAGRSGD